MTGVKHEILAQRLENAGLDPARVNALTAEKLEAKTEKIGKNGSEAGGGFGNLAFGKLTAFLLYMMIALYGQKIFTTVIRGKPTLSAEERVPGSWLHLVFGAPRRRGRDGQQSGRRAAGRNARNADADLLDHLHAADSAGTGHHALTHDFAHSLLGAHSDAVAHVAHPGSLVGARGVARRSGTGRHGGNLAVGAHLSRRPAHVRQAAELLRAGALDQVCRLTHARTRAGTRCLEVPPFSTPFTT